MESFLSSKYFFEKIGIKAAEKAPSAVILLNMLGSLNAIKNASATKLLKVPGFHHDEFTNPNTGPLLLGHTGIVKSVSFSRDGTRVLTASLDTTAKIWDANTGNLLKTLSGNGGTVYSASFNPDSTKVVTASDDGKAKIWFLFED